MWLVVVKEPLPDMAYWPGRLWLAMVDAVSWPALWLLLVRRAPVPTGLIGSAAVALAALFALNRLHRAVWLNHRYRFTTWRLGKAIAALMLIGLVLKFAMGS